MKFLFKKLWWIILIVIIIVIGGIYFSNKNKPPAVEYTTEKVKRGDLLQTVEATGNVDPAKKINVNFQTSGIISQKLVEVGRDVTEGDVLLTLDEKSLKFQSDQSAANLAQAQANLNKMLAGASGPEINVSAKTTEQAYTEYQNALKNLELIKKQHPPSLTTYQESLTKAQNDLIAAKQSLTDITASQDQNLINLYNSSFISLDKAMADCDIALNETKKILDNDDANYLLGILNQETINSQQTSRQLALTGIATAKIKISEAKISIENKTIDEALAASIDALNKTFINMTDMYNLLINSVTSYTFNETLVNTYETTISNKQTVISTDLSSMQTIQQNIINSQLNRDTQINTYQASVITAQKALDLAQANYDLALTTQDTQLNSAQSQVNSAKASYEVAQAQLDYKKAPAREVDVAAYRAAVSQMQAAYELSQKNLADTALKSPMAGTITAVNYEVGEQTGLASPAITMMSINGYNIKVDISESDIAKIKINDSVEITLDALGEEEVFMGTVIKIDPAPTILQEVIYYKIQIDFNQSSSDIKPGMTANLTILTDHRENVLYIPRRAILEKDGKKIVRQLENNTVKELEITTGLKADDSYIEITSGLSEGQDIITFEKS